MQLTLKGVPLGTLLLLLLLVSISVPGKGILAGGKTWQGQPEVSALRQSETQEAVGFARTSDWRGPRLKVAANDPEGDLQGTSPHLQFAEEEKPWSSWPRFNIQAWPNGGPEEPVCRVKLDRAGNRAPNHLEVVGLLTSHESSFLKALSRSTWSDGDLEEFGMCPPDIPHSLLSSLQHIGGYLADPGDSRFLLLHLEEVQWKDETKLRFQLTFPEEVEPSIGPLQHALLVFYHGRKEGASTSPRKKYLVGGEGLHQKQIICLSGITRYLVLKGSLMSGRSIPGQLSFQVSLAIRHHSNRDVALSPQEAQDLLFGFDEKCFTRMTPSVLLVANQRPDDVTAAAVPSSFLAAKGVVDTAPYLEPSSLPASGIAKAPPANTTTSHRNISAPAPMSTGQFLEALSQFVNQVLRPFGKPPPTSRARLQLDFDTVEALPHWPLNLSEKVALEWLVQSEDHLVVLFPEDSQALMEQELGQQYLEGKLLRQMLEKLSSVIQELKDIPSFQANIGLFHNLLAFCYYPSGSMPGLAGGDSRATDQQEETSSLRKLHSLLLLKALQAVRGHWRESKKAPRANRSTQQQENYCRLRELRIDLVSMGYIIFPEWYHANNCVGPCRSPLSTRIPDYYSHTLFLLRMHEQGFPLQRAPCCVPVKYSQSVILTFTNDQGLKVKRYPDMVAEACGCR
ncbi:LOW QUALITY PROTEIN: muellerian-inhibiting factor [Eublepharis macularius]|uniref:Muellerian-inhibiting factor n=1 Tax=Eublepharis macularius TaxID=481883 RepID=A0AA97KYF4_EUBMA|nr:LOW QUALITY PROTEIN: muellerian-inhibiting factor [Eublepharis macularius]